MSDTHSSVCCPPAPTEKRHYQESYISHARDMGPPGSRDSGDSALRMARSHSSSHPPDSEADSWPAELREMSVDEPLGAEVLSGEEPPCSSSGPEGAAGTQGCGECVPCPGWAITVGAE